MPTTSAFSWPQRFRLRQRLKGSLWFVPLLGGLLGAGLAAVELKPPLTSVLLATLLLASNGRTPMPLVIVSVVVAYVASARLT